MKTRQGLTLFHQEFRTSMKQFKNPVWRGAPGWLVGQARRNRLDERPSVRGSLRLAGY